mgnify:CR=1 FL=1
MQLFIMRHGDASMTVSPDANRPLTQQGKLEAKLMGKWLQGLNTTIDQVLVSPYVRAQQTSSEVLSQLDCKPIITTTELITPSGDASQVHDYIDGVIDSTHCQTLLMVTHMPLVSYLVETLTFDKQAPIFQTSGIAEIDYDSKAMKGQLVRLISPVDLC